jgi:hypothetical protein
MSNGKIKAVYRAPINKIQLKRSKQLSIQREIIHQAFLIEICSLIMANPLKTL